MSEPQTTPPRPGSGQDLSQRMDRMEQRHEELAKEFSSLASTVGRIELNQSHQTELNKLRFDALDKSMTDLDATLSTFMARINAIITGEVKLPQTASGEQLIADYREWRENTDRRLDAQDVLVGQMKLLGRLAAVLVGSNALAVIGTLAWLASGRPL